MTTIVRWLMTLVRNSRMNVLCDAVRCSYQWRRERERVMRAFKLLAVMMIVGSAVACGGSAATSAAIAAEAPEVKFPLTPSGVMKVAFVVSDDATLIDIAGPMQVFDQVQSPGTTGFQTFTVSETRKPL